MVIFSELLNASSCVGADNIPSVEDYDSVLHDVIRRLLELAEDPRRMIKRILRPGDIVVFDSHRILHGRTTLTMKGRRWLQWVQVERGDFHSALRITTDRFGLDRDLSLLLRGAYA